MRDCLSLSLSIDENNKSISVETLINHLGIIIKITKEEIITENLKILLCSDRHEFELPLKV